MAAPIVYRWDDGNAPVARGERRSLCDILYACLVTGYGTKPGAGWTRDFVNATFDRAGFRNNPVTGTGFFLMVNGATTANAYDHGVQGFEVLTSENDGLFPMAGYNIRTSNSANTTARPWVLIADDRAFYLIIWPTIAATSAPTNSNLDVYSLFFGDFIAEKPDDAYACGIMGGLNNYHGSWGYAWDSTATTGNSWDGLCSSRRSNGSGSAAYAAIIRGGGPGCQSGGYMGQVGKAYTQGDPIYITRPYINDCAAHTIRGYLPGFYYPCHPLAFNQLATVSSDGMDFLSTRNYGAGANSAYQVNCFISLNDWWA